MSDWRERAACLGEDPEMFFPVHPRGRNGKALRSEGELEALAVCGRCSVRVACLDEAMALRDEGIRGGLTEGERALLREKARKA